MGWGPCMQQKVVDRVVLMIDDISKSPLRSHMIGGRAHAQWIEFGGVVISDSHCI